MIKYVIISFLVLFLSASNSLSFEVKQGEPLNDLVRRYHELIKSAKDNPNISKAIELGRKSKESFKAGNREEAARLLKEAIELLHAPGDGIRNTSSLESITKRPVALQRPLNSPFGIVLTTVANRAVPPGVQVPPGIDTIGGLTESNAGWVRYDRLFVWARIEENRGVYDWLIPDYVVRETYERGINIFAVVMSYNRHDGAVRGYAPKDLKWFSEFLMKAVERYDGDGVDDAPGSPVINCWQLGNEIDNPIYYKDTPSNYAEFLKVASKAIRQVNPNAKIMLGSLSSPRGISYFEQVLPYLKGGRYFDLFDFHWYSEGGQTYRIHGQDKIEFNELVLKLKKLLSANAYADIPLWITEAGDYTGEPKKPGAEKKFPYQSEADQATSLFKLYTQALANGVSKIFWTSLTDQHGYADAAGGYFDNIGLINNPMNSGKSDKKLSYYTYRKLVEILDGYVPGNVSILKEGDVNVYKFGTGGKVVYVGWQDVHGGDSTFTISEINSKKVKVVNAVPVIKNGEPLFDAETLETREGRITYRFRTAPVLIIPE